MSRVYLKHGSKEGRIAHPLFDPAFYLARLPATEAVAARAVGAFMHYLQSLGSGQAERSASIYFDPEWYRARYPEVADAIGRGEWLWALHHYLGNHRPTDYDPVRFFSERYYRDEYPDVDAAIRREEWRNGHDHFLSHGLQELLSPCPGVDLARYTTGEEGDDAFANLISAGPADLSLADLQASRLFHAMADTLLTTYARAPLGFDCPGKPELSVIMVLQDRFATTMMALASLRDTYPGAVELILVDSGSTDATRHITRAVTGAKLLRRDVDIGRARACNAALLTVTGGAVLLLRNDAGLGHGAVAAALRRLVSDPSIGAVGGKILCPRGKLEEAGGIVWRDGAISGYLMGASPLAPEANFVREADYCGSGFLLCRGALLKELEGLDEELAATSYQDADLCVRIARAGYRVVFDPACVVQHFDRGEAAVPALSPSRVAGDREAFARKHFNYLLSRHVNEPGASVLARSPEGRARILFIEDRIPTRMAGSGFVRSNDIIRLLTELGFGVTVFPVAACPADIAEIYRDFPDTVEIMHDRTIADLPAFLRERGKMYEIAWVARGHNLRKFVAAMGSGRFGGRIVLDTEAIASLREAGRAAIAGAAFDLDAALDQEFADVAPTGTLVAVNEHEAGILRARGFGEVAVLGHMRVPTPTPRPWESRAGILFLGAIHDADSPNHDSLSWFVENVLPLVERELGWRTRLTVAGYLSPRIALGEFAGHARVTLRGPVADVAPLYDAHRVFVAPTRFAAGVPYKIHEAASYGLPVVATELLRSQLGWADGAEILAANSSDPARFASHIVRLYRDEALWTRIRTAALDRLRVENGRDRYAATLRAILHRGGTGSTVVPFGLPRRPPSDEG